MTEHLSNTDLGIRPIDWKPTPISKIVKEFRGGAPLAPSDFKKDGFLVLPKGGIIRGGNLVVEKEKQQYCSTAYALRHKNNTVNKDYTIIVLRDLVPSGPNIGLMVRINSDNKYILAQGVYGFKVDDECASPDFLIQVSNTNEYRKLMRNIMVGSTQVHITNCTFLKVQIPLPSLAEQSAIALVLSDTDNLILSLEKLISKKQAIKQSAIQQLLQPKKHWSVKKIIEIADSNIKWSFTGGPFGSNLKSSDYTVSGVRIIQLQNIGDGYFNFDSEIYTSEEKANELISCNIFPGDIIISKMGDPVARACIIPKNHNRYLMCSDGIRLAVNQRENNTYFIYTFINSNIFRTQAENNSTGSTRKRIGLVTLKNLKLIIPKIEEQNYIATILSDMDTEIEVLEKKLNKYKMLKHGMMQVLLTGKIRLV